MRNNFGIQAALIVLLAWARIGTASVGSTHISLPKGPGSIEGLGRNFVPSLASGTAGYGVDIVVPPAAGGFGPQLGLEYDSGAGTSEIGLGWRLGGTPSLRRRTENGLPRFDATDRFELVGLGVSCDLLEMSPGVFRPAEESGSFVRVRRSEDGATWEARDKSGATYRFGGPGFVEVEGANVATYLLRESVDLHGHKISYAWDPTGGRGLLQAVTWNDFGDDVRNVVRLTYETRPDPHVLFSAGIRQELSRRIKTIEVTHGGSLVRRYELTYSRGVHSQLVSVELVGADDTSRLPTLSFSYTEPSFASDGQITTMANPPGRSPMDANVEIADLNGDGLPDLLVSQPGQFRSYVNDDGHSWGSAVDWSVGQSPSVALGATGVQLADLDGDGALDLVAKSGLDVFRYFPGRDATSFAPAVPIARVPNFSFEDPDVKLGDLDGDRRTDVAITTAAGLAIAYNLGGADWTEPAVVGVVDASQALRFSDGHTQLCDVNGDRVLDLCYLRPGALTYWLGRGRGRFEPAATATGVPLWDPSSPWELHDLDGDGWIDLAHVGVDGVDYALATGAGQFDAPRRVRGTPENSSTSVVRFADMNGSGTTDIVWIDVSGRPTQAWRYLELFPDGRAGLLRRIANGLGKVTTITYAPAALDAAAGRTAGKPWTSRMNVAMPVVHRVEIDDSIGDPILATEYSYQSGNYDPAERTFAGFAGGTERVLGDSSTPTVLTESTFDVGLVHRMLRGAVLTTEQRDEHGYLFARSTTGYTPRPLGTSLDGRTIDYAYRASERVDAIEGADASKARTMLTEWEQDDYGDVTAERRWGEVTGDDKLAGADEAITIRTYATDTDDWILGRLATEHLEDAQGHRVSARRIYYDGEPFVGLPLGHVARGDVSRREEWVGPAGDAWELDIATAYDSDGRPTETKDARGGGRLFAWDPDNHTTLRSESVKLESGVLTESATIDPAFGNLLGVTGYDGQDTRFRYDAFGRLTDVLRPGDPDGFPTAHYTYEESSPVSRVVTERRMWLGQADVERTEELFDGLGRKRGALTREDGGKWVLAAVNLLDARGSTRRALRARFVGKSEHENPPLLIDGSGVDSWRDAAGRAVRTRSDLGIETKIAYAPFVTRHWDGAQSDASSPYEHTPIVESRDGLGRQVARSETLGGRLLSSSMTYDAAGRLLSRSDPAMHSATFGYDGRGRRTFVKDSDTGAHRMVYDATGNLTDTIRPDGKTHHVAFDLAGRVLTEDWNDDGKPEVVHTWDRSLRDPSNVLYRGKLVAAEDQGGKVENEYDQRGRVTVVHHTIDGATYDVGAKYDAQDREYLHTYPDGSSIRIERNARGQLAGYGRAVSFEYDGDGVETRRTFSTGVMQNWGYDADRRVQETTATAADRSELLHLAWSYDAAGNITDVWDRRTNVAPSADRSEHYAYDNLYRLHSATGPWGDASWSFSDCGNLLRRDSTVPTLQAPSLAYGVGAGPHAMTNFGDRTLVYDSRGRLKADGDRSYTWDDDDQLTKVTTRGGSWVESHFDLNSNRTLRIEHDALGSERRTHFIDPWSEVEDGKLVRYIVHSGHRIARLAEANGTAHPAGSIASFDQPNGPSSGSRRFIRVLGAIGRQVSYLGIFSALVVALAWTYRRTWRRSLTLALAAGVCLVVAACSGGDSNPQATDDGTVQELGPDDELLFNDQLGSLAEQTNGKGTVTGSFASYPFGVARYDTSHQTRRYANTVRDVHVGLDSMGARFYAPDLGTWTSPDPVAIEQPERAVGSAFAAANPYAYANLEPIVAKDEHGQWFHVAIGAAIGAAIGGAVEAYHQYSETGHVADWGKVAEKAAVGAVAGAVTALAGPQAGLAAVAGLGAVTGAAQGVAERLIDSGGKSAGTVQDALVDAAVGGATAGVMHGAGKLIGAATRKAGGAFKRALGFLKKTPSPCNSCFVAGTLVLTSAGTKPIEQIAIGDLVLARDDRTGETEWKPVVGTVVKPGKDIFDLELGFEDGRGETLHVTPEHPFWVEGRGWTTALELVAGDRLGTADGRVVAVHAKTGGQTAPAVYNFEVDGMHSYFVGTGGEWVHNVCFVTPAGVAVRASTLAKQGTSPLAGNFQGLTGASVDEVVSRVPGSWTMAPQDRGAGIKFLDEASRERIRMHGPSSMAPPGSNSSQGWTLRVMDRAKNYYDDAGRMVGYRANEGHIPLAGNPNAL